MRCKSERVGLIRPEDLQLIVASHEADFIQDLDYSKQREAVSIIAEDLYRDSLIVGKANTDKVTAKLLSVIDTNIKAAQEGKESLGAINFEGEYDDDIDDLQDIIDDNELVRNNFDKLMSIALDSLRTLTGVKLTKLEDSKNVKVDASEETEAGIERTSFSDTYQLELDSKDTTSSRLKKFLSFVDSAEFDGDNIVKSESFLGTDLPLNFDYVYNELHRILEGVKATEENVFKRLDTVSTEVKDSKNNNLAWLPGFQEYLRQANGQIRREFVSDMAKHKIDMKFVMYNRPFDPYTNTRKTTLRIFDDNSASTSRRLQALWKKSHRNSLIVDSDGNYSVEVKEDLLDELANIRDLDTSINKAKATVKLLNKLGIKVHPDFIKALFQKGARLYYGTKSSTGNAFIAKNGVLETLLNNIVPDTIVEQSKLMDDNIVVGLANGSAKYVKDEFSNSFRVGDKTIYTYSNNQYLVDRVRELKSDESTRANLQKSLFAKESLYLELINNDDLDFRESFDINYLSLNPLKKAKGRRSDKVTSVSPLDFQVTKIGMFNSNTNYSPISINNRTHQIKPATFFFPTTSDKSRIMLGKGLAVDSVENTKKRTDGGGFRRVKKFKSSSIDLFYDTVVVPEINRIYNAAQPSFKKNINLSTYNGNLFYMIPELNGLVIATDELEGGRLLLDIVKENPQLDENALEQVKTAVEKFLVREANNKKKEWESLGIISKDTEGRQKIDYIESAVDSNKQPMTITDLAMNFVYNYALFNTNMFQLIIGDPAQYFKSSSDNLVEQVVDTYDNIGKRLAAEIAPGISMEGPDYIQVYAEDVKLPSEYFESILKILDGITLKEFESLSMDKKSKLKAFPYLDITSTDAQEYTTWKEHLNNLLYLGRISAKEYKEASKAFTEGRNPSKKVFDKVLQPMKPVYSHNDIIQVGEVFIDKKTYIKSSSFPLIPTLTRGLELDKLRQALERIERIQGKGVRLAYRTATKVGFPTDAVSVFDNEGNFTEFDTNKFEVLSRDGFRVQQDIPYDKNKSTVNKGSQESKLIWANIIGESFKLYGKTIKGTRLYQDYISNFKELYLNGFDKLKSRINNQDGSLNMNMLSNLLKSELKRRGEITKSLLDGLDVEGGNFKLPLWLSPYADKYMSLLNSLVKNNIVSHKLTGKSFVLGSEEGFKSIVTLEEVEQTGIVFTDRFKGKLQPQHTDEKGNVQPAQVLIPFKFRDSNGVLLNVENFTTEDDQGRTVLDYTKLPADLLKSFGFRIPTQLHSNMSYMEIVGFLPSTSGDLIIAPKEFTIQMGSDFDVDKLYTYLYHTTYDDATESFSKTPKVLYFRVQLNKLQQKLKVERARLSEGVENIDDVYSTISNVMDEYKDANNVLNVPSFINYIMKKFPGLNKAALTTVVTTKSKIEKLEDSYRGGIHNRLLDIRLAVISNPAVQSSVLNPLGFGDYLTLADTIDKLNRTHTAEIPSIISESYQTSKFYDGTAGKDGIGVFSSDSIFNALAQGKDLIVTELVMPEHSDKPWLMPIRVEFGNKYNVSTGNLSQIKSLKKENPKFKTEVIAAAQNLSVDNANEQGMYKVNMNTYTFSAYSILNFLGFEEDISAPFMSQPIIVDYVNRMRESNSILKPYNPGLEQEVIADLETKYLQGSEFNEKDLTLADFVNKDASKELLQLLSDREDYPDYSKTQVAILRKFLKLGSYERLVTPIKQLLNIDSKGFNTSMYVNKERSNFVSTLEDYQVVNADRLFGDYTEIQSNGETTGVIIEPTTLAGLDNVIGNNNLIRMFGNFFLESKPSMNFNKVVNKVTQIVGRVNDKTRTQLSNSYKSYLTSNINLNNADELRADLFTRKDDGSLYSNLKKLEEAPYWENNSFLSGLQVEFVDGILNVDYNNAAGDNFDETNAYLSFIDLFRQDGEINGVIPSKLGEDLVLYSLLRGDQKAKQFSKLIPVDIINRVVSIPTVVPEITDFVDQWVRHNADRTATVEQYRRLGKNTIQVTGEIAFDEYVNTVDNQGNISLYKRLDGSTSQYERINTLGGDNFSEYTFKPTIPGLSILKANNKVTITPPINPDTTGTQVSTDTSSKDVVATRNIFEKLDTTNGQTLLESIMLMDEFKEYSNLAKAIKNQVPKGLTVNVTDSKKVSFSYDPVTINLGMGRFEGLASKDILGIIMHEFMHSVTVDNVNRYIDGQRIENKEIEDSITRLSGYKNQVISQLSDVQQDTFQNVMVKYAMSVSPYKLEALINDRTVHPTVVGVLKSIHDFQIDSTTDTDGSVKNLIDKASKVEYDENTVQAYYSLLNLKEFIAVSSTNGTARKAFIDIAGEEYTGLIRELFKALLKALGIETGVERALMSDVLTVAEVVEKPSNLQLEFEKPMKDTLDPTLESLEREGEEIRKDCRGKSKAAKGMRGTFKPGGKWAIIKDLKGLPSHKSGGVDLTIHEGGVAFSKGEGYVKAEKGMYLPKFIRTPQFRQGGTWTRIQHSPDKLYAEKGVMLPRTKKNTDFTPGNSWKIVKDLEGKPSHNLGGIDIFVDESNNVGFTNKDSKVMAKYGLVIKANTTSESVKAPTIKKRKRYTKRK